MNFIGNLFQVKFVYLVNSLDSYEDRSSSGEVISATFTTNLTCPLLFRKTATSSNLLYGNITPVSNDYNDKTRHELIPLKAVYIFLGTI